MNAISYNSSGIPNSVTDSTSSAQPFQGHTNSYFTLRTKYFKVWFFLKFCMQSYVNVGSLKPESKHLITENKRNMGIPCIYSLANVAPTDICENTLFITTIKIVIQINYQLDATISPVYYLTFIYSSTCFGRPHTHHQELNNCSSSLWFYLHIMVVAMLFSMDITMIQR